MSKLILRTLLLAGMVASVVAGAARPAVAGPAGAEIKIKIKDATTLDPKAKGKAPVFEVTVLRATAPAAAENLILEQTDAKSPTAIKAAKLIPYLGGTEPIAIALLVEGHELWMGNESYIDNEEDKYVGVFSKLAPALAALAGAGPPGSQATLLVYASSASVKSPMADLAALTPDKLGSQKEFQGNTTRNFVSGIELAKTELGKVSTPRKAIVVIGDGADSNGDASRGRIGELRKELIASGIEIYSIYFAISPDQAPPSLDNMRAFDPGTQEAGTGDDVATKMNTVVVANIAKQRFYALFPGYDEKTKVGFSWDGKQHEFQLKADDAEIGEPRSIAMIPTWSADTGGGFPWWLLIVIPLLLVVAVVVGIKVLGQKPAPVPVPVPQPVVAPPVAAGPAKTMMFNMAMGDDGPPIVGWIVPLNGPNQFQTFKLQPGVTKVGTAAPSQIVINDGYMSTEHAQFVASPMGFILQDGGSTNGSYVNERRIDKHDLVDNDVITMGKTNFKFKTTM